MKWTEIKTKSFKYGRKTVNRKKFVIHTILGDFEVFEAVSGRCYFRHPFMQSNYINPVSGMDNGLGEWFGKSKNMCKNIEEGKVICDKVMLKIKEIVSTY